MKYPLSPKEKVGGLVYFARLCDKIRLQVAGDLSEDYHGNLGGGMDLWTCQLLKVDYQELADQVRKGSSDKETLDWAFTHGVRPSELQITWWNSYMRNRGFRDDLAEILEERIEESGFQNREVLAFFDYIDVDEGR